MKALLSGSVLAWAALVLSSCTDAYEERGLCSYLGTCEVSYCKDLGSCSDRRDPTEVNYCKELGSCSEHDRSSGADSAGDNSAQ